MRTLHKFIIFFFIFFIFNESHSLEIQLGKEREWKNVSLHNCQYQLGRDGTYDIILKENEYTFDKEVDLLIHFNGENNKPWQEYLGNYIVQKKNFVFDSRIKVFGKSSGKFANPKSTLLLRPKEFSLFNKTQHVGSFTIEFWLNPATLSDGEIIFKKYGPIVEEGRVSKYSGIICKIKNSRLKWEFHDIFHSTTQYFKQDQEDQETLIEISSRKRLRRNHWDHHALSFDALSGKLTYYINGREEKAIFVTSSGQPEDSILIPRFYPQEKSLLTIGEQFYGFIDEFMISHQSKTSRMKIIRFAQFTPRERYFYIQPYTASEGEVLSGIYDLKQTGSYLRRLKINSEQKKGSYIILQYRMSNHFFTPDKSDSFLSWHKLDQKTSITSLKKVTGRYFQWKALLKGGEIGKYTPILKDLSFQFEIDEKPASPKKLVAFSNEGKVYLKWRGNVENKVNRYKIYYGIETGNYLEGENPIEVKVDQLSDKIRPVYVIPNLTVDRVYYFVITALDRNNHESEPSNETNVKVRGEK